MSRWYVRNLPLTWGYPPNPLPQGKPVPFIKNWHIMKLLKPEGSCIWLIMIRAYYLQLMHINITTL